MEIRAYFYDYDTQEKKEFETRYTPVKFYDKEAIFLYVDTDMRDISPQSLCSSYNEYEIDLYSHEEDILKVLKVEIIDDEESDWEFYWRYIGRGVFEFIIVPSNLMYQLRGKL